MRDHSVAHGASWDTSWEQTNLPREEVLEHEEGAQEGADETAAEDVTQEIGKGTDEFPRSHSLATQTA